MDTKGMSDEWHRVLGELATVRDDARVRAHLLGQEAAQQLAKLELEIENLEKKAHDDGSRVGEQALATARKLTHSISSLFESKSDSASH
jgi:hypothetical protein